MNFTLSQVKSFFSRPSTWELFKFFSIMSVLQDIAHHPVAAIFNAVFALIMVVISIFED